MCSRKWMLTVNPQPPFCVFHAYPLADQSYHIQAGALNNHEQLTTSALAWMLINIPGSIVLYVDTHKQKQPCVRSHNQAYGKHTYTQDHTLAQTCAHTSCLWLLPACLPCTPTVCLAPGLRSGATHKLCALPGFYTL